MNETQTAESIEPRSQIICEVQELVQNLNTQLNEIPDLQAKSIELEEAFKLFIKLRNLKTDYTIVKSVTSQQLDDHRQTEIMRINRVITELRSEIETRLNEVMPIREQMRRYLQELDKATLTEVSQLPRPPYSTLQTFTALELLTGCAILRNQARSEGRRQSQNIYQFMNTLHNFDIQQLTQANIQQAFGYFSNVSEERAFEGMRASGVIHRWLGSCFQLATHYQTVIAPLKQQLKSQEEQFNQLIQQQDNQDQRTITLQTSEINLKNSIEQLEQQISTTQGQNGQINDLDKVLWLSEMSKMLSRQLDLVKEVESCDYKQLNKIVNQASFQSNQLENYGNIIRLLKIKKQLSAENTYYLEHYNSQIEIETKIKELKCKQTQKLDIQLQIQNLINLQKEIQIIKEHNIRQVQEQIQSSRSRIQQIASTIRKPVPYRFNSSALLKLKSIMDPTQEASEIVKLIQIALNEQNTSWSNFMHNTTMKYIKMKTKMIMDFKIENIDRISKHEILQQNYRQNSSIYCLQRWLRTLIKQHGLIQDHNNEQKNLQQLINEERKLKEESRKSKLKQGQDVTYLDQISQEIQSIQKSIHDSCKVDLQAQFQSIQNQHQGYIEYFKHVSSYCSQLILFVIDNKSFGDLNLFIRVLEYNSYSQLTLEFIWRNYIVQAKETNAQLNDKLFTIHKQVQNEFGYKIPYDQIGQPMVKFCVYYGLHGQEIKSKFEDVISEFK